MTFGAENNKPVTELDVLWITAGLGCDGDTIAMTAATQPSIEDVLLGRLPVDSQSRAAQSLSLPWRMATNSWRPSIEPPRERSESFHSGDRRLDPERAQ